jgi:hypothetical protein
MAAAVGTAVAVGTAEAMAAVAMVGVAVMAAAEVAAVEAAVAAAGTKISGSYDSLTRASSWMPALSLNPRTHCSHRHTAPSRAIENRL